MISRALVLGAGTMGAGIAEVLARAGIGTALYDVELRLAQAGLTHIRNSLDKAVVKGRLARDAADDALARVSPVAIEDFHEVDLVIEAAPEDLELKQAIFARISKKNAGAILGSNTSSLSVTAIAASAAHPERVLGLHFFNPAPVMPLLEIVRAEQTSSATIERCKDLAARIGKTAIVVNDSPGFATSRLGLILGLEAMRMLETGVASAADIDQAMKLGYRHPMGPLELTDLVGLDVRLAIAEHLAREIGPQFSPPPILRRLVRAGKLGKKTGEGFFRWVDGRPETKG